MIRRAVAALLVFAAIAATADLRAANWTAAGRQAATNGLLCRPPMSRPQSTSWDRSIFPQDSRSADNPARDSGRRDTAVDCRRARAQRRLHALSRARPAHRFRGSINRRADAPADLGQKRSSSGWSSTRGTSASGPGIIPSLIEALAKEQSEFVRPALLRALVAHGSDARARTAILPLVMRGQDDFRGAVIEALGEYRVTYAASVNFGSREA